MNDLAGPPRNRIQSRLLPATTPDRTRADPIQNAGEANAAALRQRTGHLAPGDAGLRRGGQDVSDHNRHCGQGSVGANDDDRKVRPHVHPRCEGRAGPAGERGGQGDGESE